VSPSFLVFLAVRVVLKGKLAISSYQNYSLTNRTIRRYIVKATHNVVKQTLFLLSVFLSLSFALSPLLGGVNAFLPRVF
jgi:hypothetical protein